MEESEHGWADFSIPEICVKNHFITGQLMERGKLGNYIAAWPPTGWVEHDGCEMCEINKKTLLWKKPLHPCAAEPDTAYAFTLTMPSGHKTEEEMIAAAEKIMKHGLTSGKPYDKASKWAFSLEHTDAGVPHIHGMYQTPSGRRIAAKYFKRYWTLWDEKKKMGAGHQGGYHTKARHNESYDAYMQKEGKVYSSEPEPKE